MGLLHYIQVEKSNKAQYDIILPLWRSFIKEIDGHETKQTDEEDIIRDLNRRINIQGSREDMHFELCYLGENVIGFVNYAIDLGTIYGLIEKGYGTVMGFYIIPDNRRQGHGRALFEHVQDVLKSDGAKFMYLCPDLITGVPFWSAMGFVDSGKIDPDDKLPIYIKQIIA